MVGTGCSGTDVWIGALQALTRIWRKIFGVRFEVRHAMACENVEFKQQFILAHFDPESMFPDLMALGCSSAPDIHGKLTHIQSLAMWACGIECDSISQLSKSAAENKGCVEGAEGRTGTTAKGHLDFLRKHRPPLWQVENVKNLHAKDPST